MTIDRRKLLARSAAVITASGIADLAAMVSAARAAASRKGPPVPDRPVTKITSRVFVIESPDGFPTPENQGLMSNVIFVIGEKGVVVVDSGASVQIAEMAIRQLATVTSRPVVGIINTHYHGDHWLGNQAFVDVWGQGMPIYAHPETRMAIGGAVGISWRDAMERWTGGATVGTVITQPTHNIDHGFVLSLGDTTLRMHHYGKAHTPCDICVEVVEDGAMCVGDVLMDRRIANMEDGSYLGTFETIDKLIANSKTSVWVPAHGDPGQAVLTWQRELFEGIWESCNKAVKDGVPLEDALAFAMKDPRVASRAAETKGWDKNIGKYVSLAYLEAEQNQF